MQGWLFFSLGLLSPYFSSAAAQTTEFLLEETLRIQNVFSPQNPDFFVAQNKDEKNFTMCEKHMNEYKNQLQQPWQAVMPGSGGLWAWKMFDATGKFPDGLFKGNLKVYGSVHGCINVKVERPDFAHELDGFKGKYALFRVISYIGKHQDMARLPIFFPIGGEAAQFLAQRELKIGLCVPSSCSDQELVDALNARLFQVTTNPKLGGYILAHLTKDPTINLDAGDVAMISFLGVLCALVVIGTSLDAWKMYHPVETVPVWKKVLLGFSLYTNSMRLADTTIQKKGDHIGCLDGIRFLSMSWVVLGHVYSNMSAAFPVSNDVDFLKYLDSFAFQAVLNALPSVDSFFLLSGVLLAYLTLKELDKTKGGGPVFWVMFYIHRYLRLTGVYAFVVCLHMTLYKHLVVGPGSTTAMESEFCRDNWWKNLLYINNFGNGEGENFAQCIGQTWYLANDMQMFLIAPLIIFPLWRWKIPGLVLSLFLTILSGLIPAIMTYTEGWPAQVTLDSGTNYFEDNYVKPWCRFSPYIIGILLGYILHHTKNKPFKMSMPTNILGWGVATGVGVGVIYGLNLPIRMSPTIDPVPMSVAENVIYGGFHRMAWALALGWVVFACAKGYGGFINDLLCWGGFVPLSRLSYVIYLIHMSVIFLFASAGTFTFNVNHMIVSYINLAVLGYSVAVSAIIFVCVEMPWLNTEKLIFSLILGSNKRKAV